MSAYDVVYLRSEVARIIASTMEIRRGSLEVSGTPGLDALDALPTEDDVEEFLLQCPFEQQELSDMLLGDDADSVELTDDEFSQFLDDVESWSQTNTWLGGDDWPLVHE